jgi:hypothetical protein
VVAHLGAVVDELERSTRRTAQHVQTHGRAGSLHDVDQEEVERDAGADGAPAMASASRVPGTGKGKG